MNEDQSHRRQSPLVPVMAVLAVVVAVALLFAFGALGGNNDDGITASQPTSQAGNAPSAQATSQPGDAPSAQATSQAGDTPSAQATSQPGDAPSAQATSQPGDTPSAQATLPANSPTADPTSTSGGTSSGRLQDLDSYRYKVKLEGSGGPLTDLSAGLGSIPGASAGDDVSMEVTGAYVKPDRAEMTISVGGISVALTSIGQQEWVSIGGLVQGPMPISSAAAGDISIAVAFWDDGFLNSAGNFVCTGDRENVNGVSTRKCSIDKETFDQLRQLGGVFGDEESGIRDLTTFALELWVADAGYAVRVRAEMAGKDTGDNDFSLKVELDVTDVNANIEISPPI